VNHARLVRGTQQRLARLGQLSRAEPVGRNLDALGSGALERLREPAMQRSPLQPRNVGVERLARERVPKGTDARAGLSDQVPLDQLRESGRARHACDQLQIERLAGDGSRVRRGACLIRELRHADEDSVANARGHRHLARLRELEPPGPRSQGARHPQGSCELLHKKGNALRPVMDRAREGLRRCVLEYLREQLAGLRNVERI
jgi:hypothetical protein